MTTVVRMTTERRQRLLEEARLFADQEIRLHATAFDGEGTFSKELIRKMATRGYLAATFPESFGGLGMDPVTYGYFTEAIGKACCNTRTLITVNTSLIGESLLRFGTEAQKDKYLRLIASGEGIGAFALSEPNVGSDARSVETEYRVEGDAFVLNGRKKWISFAGIADFFLVIAQNSEKPGEVSAFLVDRAFGGVTTTDMQGLLASRATHLAEIEFNDVKVPAENLLGTIGGGFTYIVTTALDHGRYSIAWAGVAIAQEAVDSMVTYSRTRSQFGEKLYKFQLIKGIIADAITQVHAARALCVKAGEMRLSQDPEAMIETSIAKYFASKAAMQAATDCVQVHGGNGCSNQYPAERLFREAKVLEIIEGTSQLQQQLICEYGLRKYFVTKK